MTGSNLSDKTRWFLTVKCKSGSRGVFCSANGSGFSKRKPHTEIEMQEILGPFWAVLSPESTEMTLGELEKYVYYRPLAEYSMQYGIAVKPKDVKQGLIVTLAQEEKDSTA